MASKSKSKRKNTKKKVVVESAESKFYRILHGSRDIRDGLSIARIKTDSKFYPKLTEGLRAHSVFKHSLCPVQFPKKLSDYKFQKKLAPTTIEGELVWASCILSMHAQPLKKFVELSNKYKEHYIVGDYQIAECVLSEIERDLGYSIWSLSNRLQLLQITGGLKSQKDFLADIINTKELHQLVVLVCYFYSIRVEDNVSYGSFESELDEVLDLDEWGDFFRQTLIPYKLEEIKNAGVPIAWSESLSIVDRYESFVSMCQLCVAKKVDIDIASLKNSIARVSGFSDLRVQRLITLLDGDFESSVGGAIYYADLYARGRYEEVLNSKKINLELFARAQALTGRCPSLPEDASISDQISYHMLKVVLGDPSSEHSRLRLKKLALLCHGHEYFYQILGFLERAHDHIFVTDYGAVDRLVALNGPLDNPWYLSVLDELSGQGNWEGQVDDLNKGSSSLMLRRLTVCKGSAKEALTTLDIPSYRKNIYLGHVCLMSGDFYGAVENYSREIDNKNKYISELAFSYLFKSYFEQPDFSACLKLLADQIIENSAFAATLPFHKLSAACLESKSNLSNINLAIVLHFASRNGHSEIERDLSDVYENVLDALGIEIPSEFLEIRKVTELDSKEVYFLKNVCVLRILDDSTAFSSVNEIEAERIKLCQILLSVDSDNAKSYLDEIRELTRDRKVAEIFAKIQTSKIFVDEVGIRLSVEQRVKDYLKRFQQLLGSPELAYQAEKLADRLSELLAEKGHSEFKGLKLPASELEGLFSAMLIDVVTEFAFNPAYGLDTHVSTSIRHGAFEGHLRSPLAIENLLCSKEGKTYVLPTIWQSEFDCLPPNDKSHILKCLKQFTQKFENLIQSYLDVKLHIDSHEKSSGLFSFDSTAEETKVLMDRIAADTDYLQLSNMLMEHCWRCTIRSLERIREDLMINVHSTMEKAFDTLIKNIEQKVSHQSITALADAVARARISFKSSLDDVIQWFQKPSDMSRDPFDFETAVHVALQQVNNCYVTTPVNPGLEIKVDDKLDGSFLDGMCEVLFILFQNVILHSGYSDCCPEVKLSATLVGGELKVVCTNRVSSETSLGERKQIAQEAMSRYKRASALHRARKEGGSGLSKIWRIAEYNFQRTHKVEMEVTDDFYFSTVLMFGYK